MRHDHETPYPCGHWFPSGREREADLSVRDDDLGDEAAQEGAALGELEGIPVVDETLCVGRAAVVGSRRRPRAQGLEGCFEIEVGEGAWACLGEQVRGRPFAVGPGTEGVLDLPPQGAPAGLELVVL